MSPTLIVILIIVVWLIVLAPLLLRGQRPIHKAGEAFDDTRVLHEGGSQLPARRRQPKLKPSDIRRHYDDDGDYELVAAEAEDDADRRAADIAAEDDLLIEEPAAVVDGEVVADQRGSTAASAVVDIADEGNDEAAHDSDAILDDADASMVKESRDDVVAEEGPGTEEEAVPEVVSIDTSEAAEAARGGSYAVDETYTDPSDFLHPTARADAAAAQQNAAATVDAKGSAVDEQPNDFDAAADEELNEEEMEFARRRIGRGGWDPDREAQGKADRYARRQRTLLGLGIVVVLSIILALVFGAWVWVLPALTVGLSAVYLVALRTQVRQERELRARRIRHLRRARLGVRSSGEEPRRHHMGGVVLDLEDDSPDFDFLEVADPSWSVQPEHDEPAIRRPFRRVS